MLNSRTKDSYQKKLYEFMQVVHVICPSCNGHAVVSNPTLPPEKNIENLIRVICQTCGYNKRLDEKADALLIPSHYKPVKGKFLIMGTDVDPYFHLPLWLTIKCCDNILWAYNYEHLNFLQRHVDAKLRERNINEIFNSSIGSRLPKWMTSKKNREAVLKAIELVKKNKETILSNCTHSKKFFQFHSGLISFF